MKDILLIVPKGDGPGKGRKWNSSWPEELEKAIERGLWKVVTPGPLVLAALTDRTRYRVEFIDEEFQEVSRENSYHVVAFYTVTSNAKRSYKWARHFKEKGSHIVMGGVHATVSPGEAALYADTLLLGEAEHIWPRFLDDFERGETQEIYKEEIGRIDMACSPIPRFDLIPLEGRRIIPIQTARGCPHGCKFCNLRAIYGAEFRKKSLDRVIEEVEAALAVNPKATIYFTDDNLFCERERARELAERLLAYKVTWYTNSDLSFSEDDDFLKLLFKSGCRQVLIGFESIEAENLEGIDEGNFKKRHHSSYKDVIENIQSNGIGVIGSFIIGLDNDSSKTFERMIAFAAETNLYGMSVTVNTPYPGTVMFEKMKSENRIISYDWDKYTIFQPIISPASMSVDELNDGYIKLLKALSSPKAIMAKLNYFKEKMKLLTR